MAVIGFLVYFFNLNNPLFWDDNDWIINNNFVHTISWDNIKFWLMHNTLAGVGLKSNYYRPFLFFTFALNYVISGIKPLGYHLFNNLIHLTNGILVFLLIAQVFKKRLLAFLTALIFLIHPLQTEAITYIAGRGDALVTLFMLLALLLFYQAESRGLRWFSAKKVLSLIFLGFALLSRETAIIFPFLVLVFYLAFTPSAHQPAQTGTRGQASAGFWQIGKSGLSKTWPYFVVVFVYGVLRLTVLNFLNTLNFYSTPNPYSENLRYRLFTFMHVLVDYFKLLFVPINLHMERSMTVHTTLWQWPVWLGAVLVALIVCIGYVLYRKRRGDFSVWLFGWGVFFIGLAPVSGITPINAVIYEHWLYLPMMGFWLVAVFYLVKLFDFLRAKKWAAGYRLLALGLTVYCVFFAYQAIQRNRLWGNALAFYQDILKYEPASVRINNNVGNIYYNQKDLANAEKYYRLAVAQEETFAEPYFNLATILQAKGDIYGAIKLYEKAIAVNPNFYYPYQNLSVIYAQQGNLTKAVENIEKLKLIVPNNPRVYYNSALVYLALNNKEQALKDLEVGLKCIELDSQTGALIKQLIGTLHK